MAAQFIRMMDGSSNNNKRTRQSTQSIDRSELFLKNTYLPTASKFKSIIGIASSHKIRKNIQQISWSWIALSNINSLRFAYRQPKNQQQNIWLESKPHNNIARHIFLQCRSISCIFVIRFHFLKLSHRAVTKQTRHFSLISKTE